MLSLLQFIHAYIILKVIFMLRMCLILISFDKLLEFLINLIKVFNFCFKYFLKELEVLVYYLIFFQKMLTKDIYAFS